MKKKGLKVFAAAAMMTSMRPTTNAMVMLQNARSLFLVLTSILILQKYQMAKNQQHAVAVAEQRKNQHIRQFLLHALQLILRHYAFRQRRAVKRQLLLCSQSVISQCVRRVRSLVQTSLLVRDIR